MTAALKAIPGGRSMPAPATPAHNLDAEATLIGMVLTGTIHPDDVRAYLPSDAWYGSDHRYTFEAACAVADAGDEVGTMTVGHHLNLTQRLRDVGGTTRLADMMNKCADHAPAHALTLVKILLDCWALRRAETLAREQHAKARAGVVDVGAFLRSCVEELETVERTRNVTVTGTDIRAGLKEDFAAKEKRALRGAVKRCPVGIEDVDMQMGGWPRQWLAILGAESGTGKTTFGIGACIAAASAAPEDGGGAALMLSAELNREQMRDRFLQSIGYLTLPQIEAGVDGKIMEAACTLASLPIYVDDVASTDEVRGSVRRHIREAQRRGIPLRLVVVDYLQILRLSAAKRTRDMNNEQTLSAIAEEFKNMRKEEEFRDLTFLVLSQVNKEGGTHGAKAIVNHADQTIFLKRDNPDDRGQVVSVTLTFGKGRGVGGEPVQLDLHRWVGVLVSKGVQP